LANIFCRIEDERRRIRVAELKILEEEQRRIDEERSEKERIEGEERERREEAQTRIAGKENLHKIEKTISSVQYSI
jgi:hypothetical protein